MTLVFPTDTSRCALCDWRVRTTQHVGIYFVGTRAAIGSRGLIDRQRFFAWIEQQGGKG